MQSREPSRTMIRSGGQLQVALERDALVLFGDALDAIDRIVGIPIVGRHQPAHLVLATDHGLEQSRRKVDNLPDGEFMRQAISFPLLGCTFANFTKRRALMR